MKEETNNAKVMESPSNSNSSLLAKKMAQGRELEEKQSTREEKDCNSHSLMKSECAKEEDEAVEAVA